MSATKGACLPCRVRKVKCVRGSAQRCKRCSTHGIVDCVYEGVRKRGTGNTLRMGEACNRCRERKRRCDAKRPCATCLDANSPLDCQYETVAPRPRPSDRPLFSVLMKPLPSSSRDLTQQEHWAVEKVVHQVPNQTSVPTRARLGSEAAPPERALVHSLDRNDKTSHAPPESRPHNSILNGVRTTILPPFSVLSTPTFLQIPPEPHLTLLHLGGERFQPTDPAICALALKFRLRVVCRLNKLGIYFAPKKQQALLDGDTSGTFIHPFFIPAAHSLGMHFCEGMADSFTMVTLQARYVQEALEQLMEVLKETTRRQNRELQAQVALWVTMGSFIMRLSDVTTLYVKKSCDAVNLGGLRFVPKYGRPPEFSEDLRERLSVLSQIIYFENFLFLTCSGAQPRMTERIELEFRHNLQQTYPMLFEICPLTMRTQCILLVRDTVVILSVRPTPNEGAQLACWRRSCDDLVAHLDRYSQFLLVNLRRFQKIGGNSGSGVIQISCINCLAHLAVLCETLCQDGAAGEELHALCDSALERLGELTRDMCTEEYTRLDLLLGSSWKKSLDVFDSRIPHTAPEYGASLMRWREIVAGVYADFLAKLPDAEPPILTARAYKTDGRTEGSRYPNLMLPWVQQRYGL